VLGSVIESWSLLLGHENSLTMPYENLITQNNEQLIETLTHFALQLPGLVTLKDLNSHVLAINKPLMRLLGIENFAGYKGKPEAVIPSLAPCADSFRAQDIITQTSGRSRHIDVVTYNDQRRRVILSEKTCLLDAANRPVALLFQGFDLSQQALHTAWGKVATLTHHEPLSFEISTELRPRHLTDRQMHCLFWLLRGHTAASIGQAMCVSKRTVEDYIDQLKAIFEVSRKPALIERAINEGYSAVLPPSFLQPN